MSEGAVPCLIDICIMIARDDGYAGNVSGKPFKPPACICKFTRQSKVSKVAGYCYVIRPEHAQVAGQSFSNRDVLAVTPCNPPFRMADKTFVEQLPCLGRARNMQIREMG